MKIETWDKVAKLIAEERNQGRMLTNFFADEERMSLWCDAGTLDAEANEDGDFLLHRQTGFTSLYFFVRDVDALRRGLAKLMEAQPDARLVADVLGPDRMRVPLEDAFKANGFEAQTVLQRMGRKTPEESYETDSEIVAATHDDVPLVQNLLTAYFNAEQEQLPSAVELWKWVDNGGLRVKHGADGKVEGFVIYDLSPAQLYLRYWFVHPEARGRGIGGKLLRTMFAAGAQTKRQYFWVKTDNKNAIIRYKHYGFAFEPLKNTVLACGGKSK